MADRRELAGTEVQPNQVHHQRPAGRHRAARLVSITCFAIGGLGSFGFAVFGLRPALAKAGKIAAYGPWMLAFSALALGNSFPLIPFRLVDPGATAHAQLFSAGGMTDAIVSSIAFLVLVLTPYPLWRRLAVLPEWRVLKPLLMTARILDLICWTLLGVSSILGYAQGLMERILVSVCVLWVGALAVTLISVSHHHLAESSGRRVMKGAP